MLNIVIPMAGRGSRFANAGYTDPKPLIKIHGRPMIEYVTKNLTPKCSHRFIFVCQAEHIKTYHLEYFLKKLAPDCVIIPIDHVTEGAACTVLLAQPYIDTDDALMIANSDQYVDTDISDYLAAMQQYDGLIMTMPADDPKWSFINYDENGFVTMVREKEVISDEATVGIYNFKHGSDLVRYAHKMIRENKRVNGEFYVAPVYNEMIAAGKKIVYYNIGPRMHGLGTPQDMCSFAATDLSHSVFKEEPRRGIAGRNAR